MLAVRIIRILTTFFRLGIAILMVIFMVGGSMLEQFVTFVRFCARAAIGWLRSKKIWIQNKPIVIERVRSSSSEVADKIRVGKYLLEPKEIFKAYHLAVEVELSKMARSKVRIVCGSPKKG